MDALKRAIEIVGSQAALARKLLVVSQVVHNWMARKNIPAEYCPAIEKATGGAVTCEDLRPDVDWAYLRATRCDQKESTMACATLPARRIANRHKFVRWAMRSGAAAPDQRSLDLNGGIPTDDEGA